MDPKFLHCGIVKVLKTATPCFQSKKKKKYDPPPKTNCQNLVSLAKNYAKLSTQLHTPHDHCNRFVTTFLTVMNLMIPYFDVKQLCPCIISTPPPFRRKWQSLKNKCYFCWYCVGVRAQVLDGPKPVNQSVLIGTNHTLTCRRGPDGAKGFVLWEEDLDPLVTLFLNDERQAQLPKYVNFVLDPDNLYDLIITSIAVEDEGSYLCRNSVDSSSAQSVTRTVEGKVQFTVFSWYDSVR